MTNKKDITLYVWYVNEGAYYNGYDTFEEAQAKADELIANKTIVNYDIYEE
jgi:hypothetical protein